MPLKKQLLLRAFVLTIVLPIINSFGLRALYAYEIDGNIAYEKIAPIVAGAITFIEVAVIFCGFGLFLRAYYEYRWQAAGQILAINIVSALIPYCSAVVLLYLTTADPRSNLVFAVIYAVLNFTADMVILAALVVAAAVTARSFAAKRDGHAGKKLLLHGCIWSAVIFGVAGLIQKAAETAADIMQFGAPTSINDYVYLITPYISLAIYSVIGIFIAYLAGSYGLNEPGSGPDTTSFSDHKL